MVTLGFILPSVALQNDTFYTIKVGESIVNHGLDGRDHFSFHNLPYTYPHWLFDVGVYWIYHWWGFSGIYWTVCLLSATLGILIFLITSKLCRNQLAAAVVSVVSLFLLRNFLAARAQLVTYILFILAVYCIEQFLASRRKRYVVGLVIIPWLIANCHAAVFPFYFVLFLPYLADYLVGRAIANGKRGGDKQATSYSLGDRLLVSHDQQTLRLLPIMLAGAAIGYLTPLGNAPYTYLVKTVLGTTMAYISEHQPLAIVNHFCLLLIMALVLGIMIFSRIKVKLSDFLMVVGLTIMAMMSTRHTALLALIGSVAISRLVSGLFQAVRLNAEQIQHRLARPLLGIATVLLAIVAAVDIIAAPRLQAKMIPPAQYPVQAADYIVDHLDLSTIRLYNPYSYGSYLLYRGIPVFIDSRADLYTPQFNGDKNLDIFIDAHNTEYLQHTYYKDTLNKYHITHVLTNASSSLDVLLKGDHDYPELYRDQYFVIYQYRK